MNRFLFLVNPEAGRGLGRRTGLRLSRLIQRDNFKYDLVYTGQPGEAQSRARETEADVVVAVGGDGTINEVVNGIVGSGKKLGIIPAGSGNDVIKSLMIPPRIDRALEILRKPFVRVVDTASVQWFPVDNVGERKSQQRLFVNGLGMGFDASVARRVASIRRLRGTILYLVAVLQTLRDFRSPDFQIQVDHRQMVPGQKLLVAIGNGRCAGGGFYLTPRASIDDGLLDMCTIPGMGIAAVLGLIPRVMKGKHLSLKGVEYVKGKAFSIASTTPFSVHADGEIVADQTDGVQVQVKPASLSVLVSKSSGDS